jgi:alkylation response protein AidB-like acyl-CoA dehydrogenase
VDLLPNDDQSDLIMAVNLLIDHEMPAERILDMAENRVAFDQDLWTKCASSGWFGLGVSSKFGGVGCTATEEYLLFVEIGRHVLPGPFLSTVLAAHVAEEADVRDLAELIIRGGAVVGLGEPVEGSSALFGPCLSGSFRLTNMAAADVLLLYTDQRACLVDASALGKVHQSRCIDPLTDLGHVVLDDVAPLVSVSSGQWSVKLLGSLLTTAMLSGIAQAACEASVAYAKSREQFGQPIGSFQAVKHRCVEMKVRQDSSSALAALAALYGAKSNDNWYLAAAKTIAAEGAIANASDNIQNHGASGVTSSNLAHLYLKRARVLEQCFGATRSLLHRIVMNPRPAIA